MASEVQRKYAAMDIKLQSMFKDFSKKFSDVLKENKYSSFDEFRDLLHLLFQGLRTDSLHESYKLDTMQFLKEVLSFSDVRAMQNGVGFKMKLLILVSLKLLCVNEPISTYDFKAKKTYLFLFQVLQRTYRMDESMLNSTIYEGLMESGSPLASLLLLRSTDVVSSSLWTTDRANEVSRRFGQWLLLHANQLVTPTKKKRFGGKNINAVVPCTEIDGSASRDMFTILSMLQTYHSDPLLNIYTFSILKYWISFLQGRDEMAECLTQQLSKLVASRETKSYSSSPVGVGSSKFYDDVSSGSSASGQSLSSSVSSLHSFMYVDEIADSLDVRRINDTTSSDSRPHTPFRKHSQAFDTLSITSDILTTSSNLKNIAIRYCLKIISQSEKTPRKDSDRKLITAAVVECVEILDILCCEDSNIIKKVFVEVKRLYQRIENNPFGAYRVCIALIQLFIHHSDDMLVQLDDVLNGFFDALSEHFMRQSAAYEVISLCLRNKSFFKEKSSAMYKYFPNILKLIAWWPCTFLEEACELIEIFVNPTNATEVFHAILDLPCVAVLLNLKHQGNLDDQDKLQQVLGTPMKPYYSLMFTFILRATSGGAETIDKLSELHHLLRQFKTIARVKYTVDVVIAMLCSYFDVVERFDNTDVVKNLFPVILERAFLLFVSKKHENQIHEIFADQLRVIATSVPDIMSVYHEETLSFLTQVSLAGIDNVSLISNVIWSIGERATDTNCTPNQINSLYDSIDTYIFMAFQNISTSTDVMCNPQVTSVMMSSLAKIASGTQDLIPRAINCLSKIFNVKLGDTRKGGLSRYNYLYLLTHARELINTLKKPKVAPAILCDEKRATPWHLDPESSLLLKADLLLRNSTGPCT